MRYLHTMVRVSNLEQSLDFYCNKLGLKQVRRVDHEAGRFTLVFVAPTRPGRLRDRAHPQLGPRGIRGRPQLRACRLRGRRHLRALPAFARRRRHDQPAAARRQDGLHPLAGQHLGGAAAKRRGTAEGGALGVDAELGNLVTLAQIALDDAKVAGLDVVAIRILEHDAVAAFALGLIQRLVGRLNRAR